MCSTMAGPRRGSGPAAQYYPKLQVAVPFTPVPGPRLLGHRPQQLLAGDRGGDGPERPVVGAHHLHRRCRRGGVRAARLADPPRRPISLVQPRLCELRRFPRRADAAASARRSARSAPRPAKGSTFRALRGAEIGPAEWDAMWAFYQDTGSRKWGRPYLTREFFDLIGERMGDQLLLFLACRGSAADRRRAQLHRAGHALRPLLGLASRRCRSSISSSAITRRSNGRSSTA